MIVHDLSYQSFGHDILCSISEQCKILEISRSHFYDWIQRHEEREERRRIKRELDFERAMIVLDAWSPVPFFWIQKGCCHIGQKWSRLEL